MEVENVWYGQTTIPTAPLRSVGLHPWYLKNIDLDAAGVWLEAQLAIPGTIAVGEAGLDKVTDTPWDLQLAAFQVCITVAQAHGRPLLVHCVRAYSEVLACLKEARSYTAHNDRAWPVVFHGFDKHPNTAREICAAGHYLSFGAALLKHNSPAAEALRQTPENRFFLETDSSDLPIEAIYEQAAALRGLPVSDLKEVIKHNYKKVFGV